MSAQRTAVDLRCAQLHQQQKRVLEAALPQRALQRLHRSHGLRRERKLAGHARRGLCGGRAHGEAAGVVSTLSAVSTMNTARSVAGSVLLAFALTSCRSPGFSWKASPSR